MICCRDGDDRVLAHGLLVESGPFFMAWYALARQSRAIVALGYVRDALARRGDGDVDLVVADGVLALLVGRDLLARLVVLADDLLGDVTEVGGVGAERAAARATTSRGRKKRALTR